MNILGMGPLEILLIALIAFIFLGPERMTDASRLLGKVIREGRKLASDIPRVVVEDDDIKVVERGKSTSLINDTPERPTQPAPQDPPDSEPERDGPVPFSRGPASSPQSNAADSRGEGPLQ